MLCFDRTLRRRELEGVRANEPELVLVVFVSMVGVSAEPIVLALTMNRLVQSLTDALFKRETCLTWRCHIWRRSAWIRRLGHQMT